MPLVKSVTSRDNPLLVRLRRLAGDPGGYRRDGEIWLEGDHLCSAFVQSGGAPAHAVITEAAWQDPSWNTLASHAAQVVVVPESLMNGLSALESAARLGFVVTWPGARTLAPRVPSVVLDRLQDAGNVGTIMRSAAALGIEQIIAMKGTAALWSPKVLRAAMGAHFRTQLVEGASIADLDELGVALVATSPRAVLAVHEVHIPSPCAWVLGHEGQGVDEALLGRCELTVRIPQPGSVESLNVASAAAICFYEGLRQRLA